MTTKQTYRPLFSFLFTAVLLPGWLVVGLAGCNKEEEPVLTENPQGNVILRAGDASASYLDNTAILLFNASADTYNHMQINVAKDIPNSVLSMQMVAGTWNLALLSCDEPITSGIRYPTGSQARSAALMWETPETTGTLTDMPANFSYVYIPGQTILANTSQSIDAPLSRNVSKIEIVLGTLEGFDAVQSGTHPNAFAELLDVPCQLAWDGGLYPNKTTPALSGKPMKKLFTFDAQGNAGQLDFIVPAHRGSHATDTTTHKLKLQVTLPVNGQPFNGAGTVDIPFVPRPNRIIRLTVHMQASEPALLDLKVTVKDWVDEVEQVE